MPSDPTLATYEQSAWSISKSIYDTYNGGQVADTSVGWPASLVETTNGTVDFPSGTAAATIPSDEIVKYQVSTDGKSFAVFVSGGPRNEIAVYDSESNELTWLCDTGAPTTCPTGGLDPDDGSSDGGATTSSNS
jgi:hypothetical protein